MRRTTACLLLVTAISSSAALGADTPPLFAEPGDTPLAITIDAPLSTLMGERPDEEELAATATWQDPGGETVTVAVDVRTRGNYRRQERICPFAPLRLDFRKKDVAGTLFDGQDKLKMVTHCKTASKRSRQFLLREYLVYRMFNSLADLSYRVRLLDVTWRNTEASDDPFTAPAFLIEHDEALAARTGLPEVALERTTADKLEPAYTSLTSVFHYFIGNTDFSPVAGAKGETCCHNSTLFGEPDGPYYPVPYDFDMSGMVNADYASPNPRFKLRDVQSRLYRGRCRNAAHLEASFALFRQNEALLYALVQDFPGLAGWTRKDMRRFMDEFFKELDRPERVLKDFADDCVE